jgi:hypothetical protein
MKLNHILKPAKKWYHLSTTLRDNLIQLSPRDNAEGFNRSDDEPNVKRICVSPTIEQCLVAIPYSKWDTFSIYQPIKNVNPKFPTGIFDSEITDERWIVSKTWFKRIGILDLNSITTTKKFKIKPEVASDGNFSASKKLYDWWLKRNINSYIIPIKSSIDIDTKSTTVFA